MYNNPRNRCEIVQPKSWDFIMDSASEDIRSNPRLIFTPKHKDWRDLMIWLSPKDVSSIFEKLPFEDQKDIFVNDRDAFKELPDETKERFNANYFATGGQTNPTPVTLPVNPPQNPKKTLSNTEDPIYDGGMLPEVVITEEPMPWYEKAYRKFERGWENVKNTPTMTTIPGGHPYMASQTFPTVPSTVGQDLSVAKAAALPYLIASTPVQMAVGAESAYNLASENGVRKTINEFQNENYGAGALSLAGDGLDLLMTYPAAKSLSKIIKGRGSRALFEDFTDFNTMIMRMNAPAKYDGRNPFWDGKMTGFRKWALDNGASPEKILAVERVYSKNNWEALKKYITIENDYGGYNSNTNDIFMYRADADFNQIFPHEVEHKLFYNLFGDTRNSVSAWEVNAAFKEDSPMWKVMDTDGESYFIKNDFEEILTRFSQIKNALGITGQRALTESELRKAYRMLKLGDYRISNNRDMWQFFESIKNWQAAARLSGKALSLAGVGTSILNTSDYEETF